MLEEAWHWMRVATSPAARLLGYRSEAAALRVRHRRCRHAWEPHLLATRDALRRSARHAPGAGLAVVLGGGILRDVPWNDLIQIFREVVLVDIAFHPEAFNAVKLSQGRLRLHRTDVTGYVETLARVPDTVPFEPPDSIDPTFSALMAEADWIASVNLLTQAPLLPCAWLLRHGVPEKAVEAFAVDIMAQHLAQLTSAPAQVCLVAEVRDRIRLAGPAGVEEVQREAFIQNALGPRQREELGRWEWRVHPVGELPNARCEVRDLMGLHLYGL